MDGPGLGAGTEPLIAQEADELRQVLLDELESRPLLRLRKRHQLAEVPAVGLEGVLGQTSLDPEVGEVVRQRLISTPSVHVPRLRVKKSRPSVPSMESLWYPPVAAR